MADGENVTVSSGLSIINLILHEKLFNFRNTLIKVYILSPMEDKLK